MPLLPRVRVCRCETLQVFVHLLVNLNLLRASHQMKDPCVLIELRPVLFPAWQELFLCSSPWLYHLHCHCQRVSREQRRGTFQRPTGGYGHVSAININHRDASYVPPHISLKNFPSGVATRLPSTDRGFGAFEVGCGNFTAFFDSSKLFQNATNVKKTKGALAAA